MNAEASALVARILNSKEDSGQYANELLGWFYKDFPVGELLLLLSSKNEQAVKTGIWIASELGDKAKQFLSEFGKLLSHKHKSVRFFSIDAITTCSTTNDADVMSKVLFCLNDFDYAVRWKAMMFFADLKLEKLVSVSLYIKGKTEFHEFSRNLEEVLLESTPNESNFVLKISGKDMVARKFAAILAGRCIDHNPGLMEIAKQSSDLDIRKFAEDVIDLKLV